MGREPSWKLAPSRREPQPERSRDRRHQRYEDDAQGDQAEIPPDEGRGAEEVPAREEERDPERRADEVVGEKAAVSHPADARDEGGEGPDYRHEARDDDRQAAVLLVECVGPVEILSLEEAGVLGPENGRPQLEADGVIRHVAEDRSSREDRGEQADVEPSACGEGAEGEDDRIAWEKGRHDEAGFAEDEEEHQDICDSAILLEDRSQISIDVEDYVDELQEWVHVPSGKG